MSRTTICARIIERIATSYPCTSPAMLANDLGLKLETVQKTVAKLEFAGRIVKGWDGHNYELSDAERSERAIDARVAGRSERPRVCPVCADGACETKSKECGK